MKLNLIIFIISFTEKKSSGNEIPEIASSLFDLITDQDLKSKESFSSLTNQISYINSLVVDRDEYEKILKDETKGLTKGTIFFDAISQVNSSNSLSKSGGDRNIYDTLKDGLRKLDKANDKLKPNSQSRFKRNSFPNVLVNKENIANEILQRKHKRNINYSEELDGNNFLDISDNLNHSRRLYLGTDANIHTYPYMASVHMAGRFICGGVLLTDDLVITAASCLHLLYRNRWYRETPHVLSVRVGSKYPGSEGDLVPALQVFFHPNFDYDTLAFNVAIIRLEYVVNLHLTNGPRAVTISEFVGDVPTETDVTVLGYGISGRPKYIFYEPQMLKKSSIPVISKRDCWYYYGEDHLGYSTFCGGTYGRGSGACGRDRGGPAIRYGKLVGIVSDGPPKCADLSWPIVFTHIGRVSDWIKMVTSTGNYNKRKEFNFGNMFIDFDASVQDDYKQDDNKPEYKGKYDTNVTERTVNKNNNTLP